ncbi:MAG: aquaporin family protein [Pseudomonadota bacterium]|nr:aquaporin family protein [Pseudomonadota bacterium]
MKRMQIPDTLPLSTSPSAGAAILPAEPPPTRAGVRELLGETLGTAGLLAVIIGSGIMAQRLSNGNIGVALLGVAIAIATLLYVLIEVFGPISGAHFNPLVSFTMALRGRLAWGALGPYVLAQFVGAMLGAWLANLMFDMSFWQVSTKMRTGSGQWLGEFVATFGLLVVVLRAPSERGAAMVASFICAAIWFTSSTSFANPAVSWGRMFTDTLTGIAPSCVPGFVLAEVAGAVAALLVCRLFETTQAARSEMPIRVTPHPAGRKADFT